MSRNVIDERPKNASISKVHETVFRSLDHEIKNNIDTWTCDDIRSVYFDWWHELKYWRTTSSNFGGYSEFLIFRFLFHVLEERGENLQPIRLGHTGTDPIVFRSERYEIGNGNSLRINGKLLKPDIYLKDLTTETILAIIEIKITTGSLTGRDEEGKLRGGEFGIKAMIERLNIFRLHCQKMLLIVFNWESFRKYKSEIDEQWFSNIVLEDEPRLMKDVLLQLITH